MAQLFWLALGLLLASSVADAATANYTFTVLISIFSLYPFELGFIIQFI
jgi:hypothetical protein